MKIYLIVLFFGFFICVSPENLHAQISGDFANNNCVKKDNILIEGFYGWPYLNGVFLQSIGSANTLTRVKNTNHIGGKFEFMLDEKLGIGGEFTYADASINYQTGLNGNWQKAGITKMRILGRFNYHFSTSKIIDPYFAFGAGYKRTVVYDSGNTSLNQNFNLLPISFKTAIGIRVFFNDLIGFNAEIGIGGPLLSAGLCVKI